MFIFIAFFAGLVLGFFVAAALSASSEAETKAEAAFGLDGSDVRPRYQESKQEYGGS